ncbi:hypothetical protein DA83_00480 [Pseudomonas sp. 250J]|uniref:TonB-dependent receptor n=1 Tax=Pseudomonas peradeniyensis TaxID=2745488 RepID=A0ABT2VEB8_9PSED|nr:MULTISPECIES: TonB-dependent receptor [Pseudomonas]KNX77720.1 hypothetical protein DA83_00480 [Pseudomonas sp. 250J]MCU7240056.1 TonB-dependent receptor [Pseudomonas peradeniyensis]MCU7282139.1 TonB-dependent receptor [Pseudomonas peradeniyensis]
MRNIRIVKILGCATAITNSAYGETIRYTQSDYLTLDAMARYQVTEQLSVTLNGNNLTDRKYFNNLGFYSGGYYGIRAISC